MGTLHTSQLGEISLLVNTILDEDMKDREKLSESLIEHIEQPKQKEDIYLYKFDDCWRIGRHYQSKNCLVYMDDSVLGKEGTTWYEVHKGHSSLIPVSLAVARINSHEDLILVNSDVLTISRGDNISGAYLSIDENVYQRVKSVYMKGKFHTEFKEETLPGWYDEVEKDVFLKRNQEEKIYIYK